MNEITSFKDEYSFLSNFHPCRVEHEGLTFECSEAAYQAQKCQKPADKALFCSLNGAQAKRLGRRVAIRPDWEDIRYSVMLTVVREKFTQNLTLAKLLLKTGNARLEEGNSWGDIYWGVCNGAGENRLGEILMAVREELNLILGPSSFTTKELWAELLKRYPFRDVYGVAGCAVVPDELWQILHNLLGDTESKTLLNGILVLESVYNELEPEVQAVIDSGSWSDPEYMTDDPDTWLEVVTSHDDYPLDGLREYLGLIQDDEEE